MNIHVNKQAVLLAATACITEVAELKAGPGAGAGRARPHEEAAQKEQR